MLPRPLLPCPPRQQSQAEGPSLQDDYRRPDRSDRPKAFLPAIMATSGRIQGELLRLLFIISHRQAEDYFDRLGDDPSNAAFTTRRAIYYNHNRACIGLACAQAVASRAYLPSLPLQRRPLPPPTPRRSRLPSYPFFLFAGHLVPRPSGLSLLCVVASAAGV